MKSSEQVNNKIKRKNNIPIIILIVLIVVLIGVVSVYKFLLSNPKAVFDNVIDGSINKISSYVQGFSKDHKTIKGSSQMDFEIVPTDEEYKPMFDFFNNIDLNYDYEFDFNNKIINTNINTKYKNKDLLKINASVDNDTLYAKLADYMNQFISIKDEKIAEIFNTNYDYTNDVITVMNSLGNATKKALSEENIKQEKTTVTINGKNENVTKNYISFDTNKMSKFINKIENTLINDDKFIKALTKLCNIDENELKNMLKNSMDNGNNDGIEDNSPILFTISLYTKGTKLAGFEFDYMYNNESVFDFQLLNENDIYYFAIKESNQEFVKGNVKITNTSNTLNQEYNIDIPEVAKIKITNNNSFEYDTTINKLDVSNSKDINSLTEEEQNEIMNKIMQNSTITEFLNDYDKIMNSILPSDNYQEYNSIDELE